MSAIYKSLEIETDSDKFEKALSEYEQKFIEFFKQAGGLRNVDVCRTAPLGNSIQRVGYILNYDHNLMFADSWFINSSYGWILASAYFHFSSDASDTLNKIPNAYFEE